MTNQVPDFEAMSDEDFMNHASAQGVFDEVPQDPVDPDPEPEAVAQEASQDVPEDPAPGEEPSHEERPGADVGDVSAAFVSSPAQTLESKLDAAASKTEAASPKDSGETSTDPDAEPEAGEEVPSEAPKSDASHTTPQHPKDKSASKPDPKPDTKADTGKDSDVPKSEAQKDESQSTKPDTPPDYEALYKQVMAPFKANGREFTPTSPEEVVRLMQMGANYTKKMQGLAPRLKLLRMLDNNQLLDEDRISFLIDLHKGEKGAIQKLLHDGKIDPLDLDTSVEPSYKPGNHRVSDADMAFHDALETVVQSPTGRETIKTINDDWDDVSKKAIFAEPSLLQIFDTQRQNGIYGRISAEIERRRILGEFRNVPFIDAYKTVGDELHAQGKLFPSGSNQAAPAPQGTPPSGQPVAQPQSTPASQQPSQASSNRSNRSRPAATREQVRAVSPAPGTSTRTVQKSFDPLTMSDEEIMAVPTPF